MMRYVVGYHVLRSNTVRSRGNWKLVEGTTFNVTGFFLPDQGIVALVRQLPTSTLPAAAAWISPVSPVHSDRFPLGINAYYDLVLSFKYIPYPLGSPICRKMSGVSEPGMIECGHVVCVL